LPAKDHYHDTVIRALLKDGWTIVKEQVSLKLPKRRLWVDIQATKSEPPLVIFVEVKGLTGASMAEVLASTVGQYMIYQGILNQKKITAPLYLAVPVAAYETILKEPLGQVALSVGNIKLMVFDPSTEEIVKWQP
jgi:hypothetical protein